MDWLERKRDEEVVKDRTAKRAAWDALKTHCPEFIPDVRRMAELFGIAGVTVEAGGETVAWGDVEHHDA